MVLKLQILTFILLKEAGLKYKWPKVYVSIPTRTGNSLNSVTAMVQKISSQVRMEILKKVF